MPTTARAQVPFTQDAAYSRIARHGDTMDGPLELWQDPIEDLDAATKQYVDAVGARVAVLEARSMPSANVSIVPDPQAFTGTAWVMIGPGITFTVPSGMTRAIATMNGQIGNGANNGQTQLQLCFGLGTPPNPGDAQTGTLLGLPVSFVAAAAGDYTPFSQTVLIEGMAFAYTYWISGAVSVPHGSSLLSDLGITAFGLFDPIAANGGGGGTTPSFPDAPSDGYVYGRVNGQWVRVTPLSGGTMTGPLILSENPT